VTVLVPLVAILGVVAYVAWRYMGLRVWHAVICLLFGFLLAATSAAPEIHRVVAVIVQSLSGSSAH
jgi:predicted transcriptional regulator